MSRVLIVLFALSISVACDRVIERHTISDSIVSKMVSCHKSSFCYTCNLDYNGKYGCGMKLSTMCPGKRPAKVREVKDELKWESGAITYSTINTTMSYEGNCQ